MRPLRESQLLRATARAKIRQPTMVSRAQRFFCACVC